MSGLMMPPLSLVQIREKASAFRKIFGLTENGYVDIVKVLENLQEYGVEIEIAPVHEMANKHGQTYPAKPKIVIREDIYERACEGHGRDRLTIAHEIGHLFLHGTDKISLARVEKEYEVPIWCDPEWQANAFAGELLAPFRFIKRLSISDIQVKYGVSATAAKVQKTRRA